MNGALLLGLQVLCGAALGFTGVTLLGLLLVSLRAAARRPAVLPPLLILRPCEGPEPALADNLRSTLAAAYPGQRRVLVLVPTEDDPACAAARQVAASSPGLEVVVTGIAAGGNRKVAQLVCGLLLARPEEDLIVSIDSDVRLVGDELLDLVAALSVPRAGAAFCAPLEEGATTLADRASAAVVGESQQSFLSLYAVTAVIGGVPSLAGALCAYRKDALQAVGGFAPLSEILGEDYEVSRRLVGAGFSVALARSPARCQDRGRTLREVVTRVGRWLLVVRAQRPGLLVTYPFFVAATPLHLMLALLVRDPLHVRMALSLWAAREVLGQVLRRVQRLPPGLPRALWAEVLLWLGFLRALTRRRISWRGHAYRVGRGGRLLPG